MPIARLGTVRAGGSDICCAYACQLEQKKREQMNGRPHQQRPDIDNYLKSLMDAVLEEDSHIWHVAARKIWGEQGAIIVKPLGVESYPLDLA